MSTDVLPRNLYCFLSEWDVLDMRLHGQLMKIPQHFYDPVLRNTAVEKTVLKKKKFTEIYPDLIRDFVSSDPSLNLPTSPNSNDLLNPPDTTGATEIVMKAIKNFLAEFYPTPKAKHDNSLLNKKSVSDDDYIRSEVIAAGENELRLQRMLCHLSPNSPFMRSIAELKIIYTKVADIISATIRNGSSKKSKNDGSPVVECHNIAVSSFEDSEEPTIPSSADAQSYPDSTSSVEDSKKPTTPSSTGALSSPDSTPTAQDSNVSKFASKKNTADIPLKPKDEAIDKVARNRKLKIGGGIGIGTVFLVSCFVAGGYFFHQHLHNSKEVGAPTLEWQGCQLLLDFHSQVAANAHPGAIIDIGKGWTLSYQEHSHMLELVYWRKGNRKFKSAASRKRCATETPSEETFSLSVPDNCTFAQEFQDFKALIFAGEQQNAQLPGSITATAKLKIVDDFARHFAYHVKPFKNNPNKLIFDSTVLKNVNETIATKILVNLGNPHWQPVAMTVINDTHQATIEMRKIEKQLKKDANLLDSWIWDNCDAYFAINAPQTPGVAIHPNGQIQVLEKEYIKASSTLPIPNPSKVPCLVKMPKYCHYTHQAKATIARLPQAFAQKPPLHTYLLVFKLARKPSSVESVKSESFPVYYTFGDV